MIFRTCLDSEGRHLDSLHMMGLCALDLGRCQDAVNHLEQALAVPDLPAEMQAGLYFALGRAFQALGDLARAHSAYESVRAADSFVPLGAAANTVLVGEDDIIQAARELGR